MYDSINVLYASGIVERKVETINLKKEYFFRPQGKFSRRASADCDIVSKREETKLLFQEALKRRMIAERNCSLLESKLDIFKKLIDRNKRANSLQFKQLDLGNAAQSPFRFGSLVQQVAERAGRKDRQFFCDAASEVESQAQKPLISIPFYVYSLKSRTGEVCQLEHKEKGRKVLKISSQTDQFLYHDFELIRKLI